MIDKENLHEWISRYTDGELNEHELKQFRQIMASDHEVRAEAALDMELTDFLRDRDLLEFLEVLERTLRGTRPGFGLNCLLLAALLTVLIAMIGFWLYIHPVNGTWPSPPGGHIACTRVQETGSSVYVPQTIRRSPGFFSPSFSRGDTGAGLLAATFRPLDYLEGWVGATTRSASFILLSPDPAISVHPGDTIRFTWRNRWHDTLSFAMFDNRGEQLVIRKEISGYHLILSTGSLPEGLYYWKFMDQGNLLKVGKILVRE